MRLAFLMVVSLLAGCAFQPEGPGSLSDDDDDGPSDTDAASVTDPDATPDTDAEPSTTADASLPLTDANLPLPDASLPLPDAQPIDAGMPIDAPPVAEMACSNGDDDDDDGKTDCRDDDCPGCGGLSSCCASGACALICL